MKRAGFHQANSFRVGRTIELIRTTLKELAQVLNPCGAHPARPGGHVLGPPSLGPGNKTLERTLIHDMGSPECSSLTGAVGRPALERTLTEV